MNVILLGYRGCGKSTVGRAVAARVGRGFVDLDEQTQQAFAGRTVADIWANEGEPAFRSAEAAALDRVLKQDEQVIALGGGAAVQPGADKLLLASGTRDVRIYLKADAATLAQRIQADPESDGLRPSLTGASSAVDEVDAVLTVREPVYEKIADQVIDVAALEFDAVVDAVCQAIDRV